MVLNVRLLAAAVAVAGGLVAATPGAQAAPLAVSPAVAEGAGSGLIAVRGGHGWGHHHHHHRGWGHGHRRHHGWGHGRHHHYGWRHHHHRHHRW
ncbi:hypothetical protein [Methylobacterium nigriterrae]|uniref:hypothetical protein n=1 Tax=Methylobacterium nigriterrae TaxID=3127512 RepID=UPI003013EDE1